MMGADLFLGAHLIAEVRGASDANIVALAKASAYKYIGKSKNRPPLRVDGGVRHN